MNKSKIRILQILPTLGYGGVAQFLLNYYSYMDKNQIIFDFISHGGVESFHSDLIEQGSKIFYLKPIGKVGLAKYLKQLKNLFANNHFDLVHTHDGHLTGLTALFCKRYYDGPIICHAHTTLCVNKLHRPLMPLFRFLSRNYGDILLGCGKKACEYCYGRNASFKVIHNAVSLDRFMDVPSSEVNNLRQTLKIQKNDFVIGHIGVFSPQKNHIFIISLFEFLLRSHPNTVLVLIGDGELKHSIEELAQENGIIERIRFVGIQKNIPLYMHIFDTFILPSLYEGLPVCGVEAQTVVSNVCFSDTIDKDVDAGLGVASFIPITANAFSQWEKAIFQAKVRKDETTIRKSFINHGYDINHSVETLFSIYKEVASSWK